MDRKFHADLPGNIRLFGPRFLILGEQLFDLAVIRLQERNGVHGLVTVCRFVTVGWHGESLAVSGEERRCARGSSGQSQTRASLARDFMPAIAGPAGWKVRVLAAR